MNTFSTLAETIATELLKRVSEFALPFAIFFAAIALCLAWILVRDRSTFDRLSTSWTRNLSAGAGWLLVVFTTVTGITFISILRSNAQVNLTAVGSSEYADAGNGLYEPFSQSAPYVAGFQDQVYQKTYVVPTEQQSKAAQLGADGIAQNYFGMGDEFKKVENNLIKKGSSIVLVRKATREVEARFAFNVAELNIDLQPVPSRKGDAFRADYRAIYQFTNPVATDSKIRFRINMPQTNGQIEGFSVSVNGTRIDKAVREGDYEWLGTLRAGESAKAEVSYRLNAAEAIDLDIAETLRPVKKFTLKVNSPFGLKFRKRSIQPSRRDGNVYVWEMSDLISRNGVSILVPPQLIGRQAVLKLYSVAPQILFAFALCFLLPNFRPSPLRAWGALFGVGLAIATPMALAAVLLPTVAVILQSLLTIGLGIYLGGKKCLIPAAFVSAIPWTVLLPGFSTIASLVICAVFAVVAISQHSQPSKVNDSK